jgi:hypothetical protein
MFYWLDNFTQCLSSFFPLGHGFESHLLHCFLTFYADLIKWADGLTGWPDTVSRSA